jgi:hypothetical protein
MTTKHYDVVCGTNIENSTGSQTNFEFILRFRSQNQFEKMRYDLNAYEDKINAITPMGGWRLCDIIEPETEEVSEEHYERLMVVRCGF